MARRVLAVLVLVLVAVVAIRLVVGLVVGLVSAVLWIVVGRGSWRLHRAGTRRR